MSSTQTINGYTIIKNYGDNEEYQTDEENAENIYGNIYYYPIWKNDVSSITNVIIYNKIVPSMTEYWFYGCSKLENDVTYAHIDEGIENPGYLTANES